MEAPEKGLGAFGKEIQHPAATHPPPTTTTNGANQLDWELPSQQKTTSHGLKNPFAGFASRRGAAPAATSGAYRGRKYSAKDFARRRRKWLIIGAVVFVVIILAVGLGAGLGTKRSSKPQNLPLPNNSEPQVGDLTYYDPGLGACGITSTSEENIVSMSHYIWDELSVSGNPNENPICGRRIRATRVNEAVGEQRSVDLTVVDRCVGCQPTDIDTTTSVFDQLAPRESGRVLVTWAWLT